MSIGRERDPAANLVSRRQAVAGIVVALGSLAVGSKAMGDNRETMVDAPATKENQSRTAIHQEVAFKASAQRIYEALLDSKQFTAFTGRPAEIDSKEGGAFSLFGGLVSGRNIEFVPNQRIVQAWRPASWDQGIYSIVRYKGAPLKQVFETRLIPNYRALSRTAIRTSARPLRARQLSGCKT